MSASDLQTAISMAAELFEGCLEWPEVDPAAETILLKPAVSPPVPSKEPK